MTIALPSAPVPAAVRTIAAAVAVVAALIGPVSGQAARNTDECGNVFDNGEVGPWDYTKAENRVNIERVPNVERHHWSPAVERLEGGVTGYLMDDLDYILRAIPNHPRALNAVARYEIEIGSIPPNWRSAQCWFDRALTFRPEDGTVWLIYGNYKSRLGATDTALEAYQRAKELMPDDVEVDYNLGLLYVKLGDYDKAAVHARAAYEHHYPLQGLRRKLAEKGIEVAP